MFAPCLLGCRGTIRQCPVSGGSENWGVADKTASPDITDISGSHVTRRQGRRYTLVLNKTDALFAREQEARARDQADLEVASETAARPVRERLGPALGITDTTRYHMAMAMTLRLSDEQTEALRRKAEAEHRSMQQVALAAIDAYVHQATPARRQSVPVTELMTVFQDLPPMSMEAFRADQDRYADAEAYFDAYERFDVPEDGE